MPKFKVDVSDPAVTRGLTPYVVEAIGCPWRR